MNKKIKLIELLNKIANGEDLPKRILYENTAFVLNDCKCYYNEEIDERLLDYIIPSFSNLNEEVEILEDNTEEIEEIGELVDLIGMNENEEELFKMIRCCTHKIDELVKVVNKMKRGKE